MIDDNGKSVWPKAIGIIIIIVVISPLMISVLSIWAKPLTFIEYESSVWIGFWGSYLGGIIGTLGVIYVAFLQSREQRALNKQQSIEQRKLNEKQIAEQTRLNNDQINLQIKSLHKVENFNRERMKIETQVKNLEGYIEDLKEMQSALYLMKFGLQDLIGADNIKKVYQSKKGVVDNFEHLQESLKNSEDRYLKLKNKFDEYRGNYFLINFEDIYYKNFVLEDEDIDLQEPDNSFVASLDDIVRRVTSEIHQLDIKKLIDEHAVKSTNFPEIEKAWKWVRNEKAKAYENIKFLINKLD